MSSSTSANKKRTLTSAVSHCLNWYIKTLEENAGNKPKIYVDGERYQPDEPYTMNQTQIHFKMTADGSPKSIKYRMNSLQDEHLLTLQQFLVVYGSLTEMYFEFCDLTTDQRYFIHMILQENPKIVHLSLNGNPKHAPTEEETHHLPMHGTHLLTYSAQLCNLGPPMVNLMTDCSAHLIGLNIGCNHIGDEGCALLCQILRSNRTLQALNISDNGISEQALLQVIEVLGEFKLTAEETSDIWKLRIMKYTNTYFPQSITVLQPTLLSVSNVSLRQNTGLEHTFMKTVTDGVCSGNSSIMLLNISYNQITPRVLETLIETINYQKAAFKNSGLKRVFVESNPRYLDLQHEINRLLSDQPRPSRHVSTRPASVA